MSERDVEQRASVRVDGHVPEDVDAIVVPRELLGQNWTNGRPSASALIGGGSVNALVDTTTTTSTSGRR